MLLIAIGVTLAFRSGTETIRQRDGARSADQPLQLHPANPHYFLFRGRPTVLITSGEHYGALINLDFDYVTYLDELESMGFNLTRVFSGAHVETAMFTPVGSHNTMAPRPHRLAVPWARTSTPGYAYGGGKFDLTKWDDAYFARLRDFVGEAGRRGIVVELTFFSPSYTEDNWKASPLNEINNVNGLGGVPLNAVHTLANDGLLGVQERLVSKIIGELRSYDNVYYEVVNEPFHHNEVADDWQKHMIETLLDAQESSDRRHLIAENVGTEGESITPTHPAVSILNFHYAHPDAVTRNYPLKRVVAYDENAALEAPYRSAGWSFMLAGGGVFNLLDWSFTAEHETGTLSFPANEAWRGSEELRTEIRVLKEFMETLALEDMRPISDIIRGGIPAGAEAWVLGDPGVAYAIYVLGGESVDLMLDLPMGSYWAEWIDPRTGSIEKRQNVQHNGGVAVLTSPRYEADVVLRVTAK
jgi:hypothetical protein